MPYLLGIDLGSSSVKAALLDVETGACAGSAFHPETEMPIRAPQPGFAEQDPADWYESARAAVRAAMERAGAKPEEVRAVGISYQMHGLVCLDEAGRVLRPAIIWCDSRAVEYGRRAFEELGPEYCLSRLLNSPGNFTAAKLAWVKENEPEIFARTRKILLPGDWLAFRLTGRTATTVSGLSEGIFWDFAAEEPARFLLDYFGFPPDLLAETVPTFGFQGELTAEAAADFGLAPGTPVTYRAGDQPNNALSLNVLEPGEIAATAGTSGVVYGVTDRRQYDPRSRVNTFAHVNHSPEAPRLGVLLCINGAGISNAWTRRLLGGPGYSEMDAMAASVPAGSEGVGFLPFGNGAERMLDNRCPGARIFGLDFNRHTPAHLCRAVQEGVVFAFRYGMAIMESVGLELKTIRAGFANMFMSEVFCSALADVSGAVIELYETDGALGAARGAGVGAGVYASLPEAFRSLRRKRTVEPGGDGTGVREAYERWKEELERIS